MTLERIQLAELKATGVVAGLATDGVSKMSIFMGEHGPHGDRHAKKLYSATREENGATVFGRHGEQGDLRWDGSKPPYTALNHRCWTATSAEEIAILAKALGIEEVPMGGVLDTFRVSGIDMFTAIPAGFQLGFYRDGIQKCRVRVTDPNTPCKNAAQALWTKLGRSGEVTGQFRGIFGQTLLVRRGLMGDDIVPGTIHVGDEVRVFSSKRHPDSSYWD